MSWSNLSLATSSLVQTSTCNLVATLSNYNPINKGTRDKKNAKSVIIFKCYSIYTDHGEWIRFSLQITDAVFFKTRYRIQKDYAEIEERMRDGDAWNTPWMNYTVRGITLVARQVKHNGNLSSTVHKDKFAVCKPPWPKICLHYRLFHLCLTVQSTVSLSQSLPSLKMYRCVYSAPVCRINTIETRKFSNIGLFFFIPSIHLKKKKKKNLPCVSFNMYIKVFVFFLN